MKPKAYLFLLTFILTFIPSLAFSQETLTITTYYPSPYGNYRDLNVNRRLQMGNSNTWWINDPISGRTDGLESSDAAIFVPVYTGAQSDLRLYIVDDADDRFSIWGNTCGGGDCVDLNRASNIATFMAGGNVGIGTVGPGEKLHVVGNIRLDSSANPTMYFYNGGTALGGIQVDTSNNKVNLGDWFGAAPALAMGLYTNDIERIRIDTSGNVGIGTVSPQSKLQVVNGDIYLGGDNASGWGNQLFKVACDAPDKGIQLYADDYFDDAAWGTRMWKEHHNNGIGLRIDTQQGTTWWPSVYIGHGQQAQDPFFGVFGGAVIGANQTTVNLPPNNGLLLGGNQSFGEVTTDRRIGLSWHWEDGTPYGFWYGIAREPGPWSFPYPDLRVDFHTGLQLRAHGGHGGVSVWEDWCDTGIDNCASGGTGIGSEIARFRINPYGGSYILSSLGIATNNPQGTLDVNGTIYQRGALLHADYVFEPGYALESIEEHADYMWKNKHLESVPVRKLDENGQEAVEIGSHSRGILEELEKAHVYIQQLNERIKVLEAKIKESQGPASASAPGA